MIANWDIKTANDFKLPKIIKGICKRCRCCKYCHKPITLFDAIEKEKTNADS